MTTQVTAAEGWNSEARRTWHDMREFVLTGHATVRLKRYWRANREIEENMKAIAQNPFMAIVASAEIALRLAQSGLAIAQAYVLEREEELRRAQALARTADLAEGEAQERAERSAPTGARPNGYNGFQDG